MDDDPVVKVLSMLRRLLDAECLDEHELELAPISELIEEEDQPRKLWRQEVKSSDKL